jgi:hypothetical protein
MLALSPLQRDLGMLALQNCPGDRVFSLAAYWIWIWILVYLRCYLLDLDQLIALARSGAGQPAQLSKYSRRYALPLTQGAV